MSAPVWATPVISITRDGVNTLFGEHYGATTTLDGRNYCACGEAWPCLWAAIAQLADAIVVRAEEEAERERRAWLEARD